MIDGIPAETSFAVWAIADLHLSFGIENKSMEVFGPEWVDWTNKIEKAWIACVSPDDLVLLSGDISWAMHSEDALPDLRWIEGLPGTKVMIRGNHDYWWTSKSKVEKILPPSIHIIQNSVFQYGPISIGGARLWDSSEYDFSGYIIPKGEGPPALHADQDASIFARELGRLELSLQQLDQRAKCRIAMTHYPPIGPALADSKVSLLCEKYRVDICVFGHLHNLVPDSLPFGEKNGIRYFLTSCDYLGFKPMQVCRVNSGLIT